MIFTKFNVFMAFFPNRSSRTNFFLNGIFLKVQKPKTFFLNASFLTVFVSEIKNLKMLLLSRATMLIHCKRNEVLLNYD